MKFKRKNGFRISGLFIILIIVINTFFIVSKMGDYFTDNTSIYLSKVIDKNLYKIIFNVFDKELLSNEIMDEFIVLSKNNAGEIVSVDYKLNKVYGFLSDSLTKLYNQVELQKIDDIYYDKDKNVFMFPIGFISDNVLISNFGPVVPCQINFLNDVHTGLKTKITDYGINYLLVEIYVQIETISHFIGPLLDKDYVSNYEIVIASKIINGNIPNYYGGVIEKSSSIVSS
ncbi:MAG: sporulation protein YunB [Bacilli bacterium]|nr:sporulation protein YunB [Bacilli bacterium]